MTRRDAALYALLTQGLFHAFLRTELASGRPLTPGIYGAQRKLRWPQYFEVLGSRRWDHSGVGEEDKALSPA